PGAGVLQRRTDRGDDRPARPPPSATPRCHRTHLGHALQEGERARGADRARSRCGPHPGRKRAPRGGAGPDHGGGESAGAGEPSGVLGLQGEVAGKVAGALALVLFPSEKIQPRSVRAVNPEAYEAYMKGLLHWYKLTPPDLDAALRYFELALKKDPSYALGY